MSAKLFNDNISLFSVVHDSAASSASLNDDLMKISRWAYQCKMISNKDVSKQAQDIIFSRKASATNRGTVIILTMYQRLGKIFKSIYVF